jgi:Tol biopolymer transport system component
MLAVGLLAAAATAFPLAQGTRRGNPEEQRPAHIRQLTGFGERASWSPDGTRIAFMAKSFGDAFVVDVATKTIRLLTPAPSAGFLRVQYLPSGDYFLIGARTFTDIRTTRDRDQEMWLLRAAGGPPIALGHKISEGVAISRRTNRIAWSNTRGQYPDLLAEGESVLYMADIVEENGQPTLANKVELLRAKRPECTLEAQDFRFDDTELIYTCYRTPYADVFGLNLETKAITTFRKIADEYNEVEGIFPDGKSALVESSREQKAQNSNYIDIWRMPLLPDTTEFVRLTHWGEYDGYKASNPVVSPDGRTIAFQSARSKDPAGVGYGIYLMDVK